MWHSGTRFVFQCGFIFFFHWRISSQDMFQWPNLEWEQARSLFALQGGAGLLQEEVKDEHNWFAVSF